MGPQARRAGRSLDFREGILGAVRRSFERGTLLDGKALVEDVAFHNGLPLERNADAPNRSHNVAAHNHIFGRNTTCHLRLVAEQKRAATDVALNFAVDLEFAFRGDVASDRQVLADNRRDHLARTWAEALGSIDCRPLGEGRLRIASAPTQFGDFLARLGLRREHARTLHPKTDPAHGTSADARYATPATLSH